VGRTVVLRLRFDDFSRATRSHTLAHPTARTQTVLDTSRALLAEAGPLIATRGLTLIGVSLTNLGDDLPFQMRLPIDRDGDALLDEAIDEIRDRFGTTAVTRALLLGRSPGLEMPLLSD
jgi:DNA polymerase-4